MAANRARGNPLHVALDRERVVGWCEVRRDALPGREHSGTLGIGVRAPYRGAGLGRRLIDAALADAWQRGFARIELWVRSPNAAAIGLYAARSVSSRRAAAAMPCAWTTARKTKC